VEAFLKDTDTDKHRKLDADALKDFAESLPINDVWDTELPGFHIRPGKRGLTFRLYYRTKTGIRRMLTLGTYGKLTAAQARKLAKEALATVTQGGDPRAELETVKAEVERQEQQTLRAYLEGPYSAYQNRKKDGQATLRRIRYAFSDWLNKPIGKFTRVDVERWQDDQETLKKPKVKGQSPPKPRAFSTLKRDFGALYTLLEHAAERKVIQENPLKGVRLQKPAMSGEELAEKGVRRRYLEHEEVMSLFAGMDAYQDEKRQQRRNSRAHGKPFLSDLDQVAYVDHVVPWIQLMYYTGFRPGDLFGLHWEHIHLSGAKIRKTIEKTAHKRPEPQSFPLSRSAVELLTTWHQQQGEPKNGLVFPSPVTAGRLDKTAMKKPWSRVRELAGLNDKLALYTLRHNFASQLVMSNVDLLTVSKLMAHADIQTTIEHYADLADDHMYDAVDTFDRLTRRTDPNQDTRVDYRIIDQADQQFAVVPLGSV
jgi:integrase